MTQFSDFALAAPLLKALAAEGYHTPTPIQEQAIPVALSKRDIIGLAQTGTGKTAAFALPILQLLAQERRAPRPGVCRALVLAPTRELAAQIEQSFRAYGKFCSLTSAVVYGGASMHNQRQALARGVDILVATPGRLLDHMGQRTVRLDGVEILVLDEADHMLDLGFIHALKRIAAALPKHRQSLFFSATMPPPIAELAGQFLSEPVRVAVAPVSSTAERVEQSVIHVAQANKAGLLLALLEDRALSRALVFTRTKHGANRLAERLGEAGHRVEAIHGNKSQGQRERALAAFKSGKSRVLVATEIAARGIDVDDVSHVINFDLPNVPEQYVHRIGRTARAGAGGSAVSFCAPDERSLLRAIEKLNRAPVPVLTHGAAGLDRASETHRSDAHRSETRRSDTHRNDRRPNDAHRSDTCKGDAHRSEAHRSEAHRSEGRKSGPERASAHRAPNAEGPAYKSKPRSRRSSNKPGVHRSPGAPNPSGAHQTRGGRETKKGA